VHAYAWLQQNWKCVIESACEYLVGHNEVQHYRVVPLGLFYCWAMLNTWWAMLHVNTWWAMLHVNSWWAMLHVNTWSAYESVLNY
jgi:hypothetical protein